MLDALTLKTEGIWYDRLLDYTGGDTRARDMACAGLAEAGRGAGIAFDFGAYINRQPIDSQRMLIYAARQGKQEAYVSALSKRHFTQGTSGESASLRPTILAAAAAAGLDRAAAERFLASDELRDVVWRSYGDMARRGIGAIPLFVFNCLEAAIEGGPLRPDGVGIDPAFIVNGSMDVDRFAAILNALWERLRTHRARTTRELAADPRAAAHRALVGKRVRLHGLTTRPALNGAYGTVRGYDERKGRCAVRIDGSGESCSIRPANLRAEESANADGAVEAAAAAAALGPAAAALGPAAVAAAADDDEALGMF